MPLPAHLSNDPVIPLLKQALVDRYGDRLRGVLLYGSRARGDFGPESDYDLVVLLDDLSGPIEETLALGPLCHEIQMQTGEVLSITPAPPDLLDSRTGFTHELRKDGIWL
jgi:nucleotidyltransferase-like protein